MLSIVGKVLKKERKKNPVKVKLLIGDEAGKIYKLQVRPKHILKLVEVDTGCIVQVTYTNEKDITDNLIVEDIIIM